MTAGDEALAAALAAEHATIFGYGVAGARLAGQHLTAVREAEQVHRARRDTLLTRLIAASVQPPSAEPAYALPFPVTDAAGALRLAVHLEERTAAGGGTRSGPPTGSSASWRWMRCSTRPCGPPGGGSRPGCLRRPCRCRSRVT